MGVAESKAQKNTFRALSKLFLQRSEWTKLQLQAVLMDMEDVLAGGRTIQQWLDAKVAIGYLRKDGELYAMVKQK